MTAPHKKSSHAHVALVAVYFFLAGAASVNIAIHETRCSEIIDRIAEKQSLDSVTNMDVYLNPRLMGVVTSFFLRLTNPHISSAPEAARNEEEIVDLIKRLRLEVAASAGASLVLLGFTALFLMGLNDEGANGAQRQIYALLSVSLIFFVLGIGLPVLTAVVKGQHMLVGGFIIQTASKGIVSTVHTLLKSGNWIIAILLAGFSIVIPIFKGIAALVASVTPSEERRIQIGKFLEAIGKWSLTDVLVAAVLLGCFSLNAIQQVNGGIIAVPRFAFGFFVFYCILAARTSYLLKKIGRNPPPVAPRKVVLTRAALFVVALASGAIFGRYLFQDFAVGRKALDLAVVKLVRTHTELLTRKRETEPGQSTAIPFERPFEGTVTIQVKSGDGERLEIALLPDVSDNIGASRAQKPLPIPSFAAAQTTSYERSGKLPAGKYDLTVKDSADGTPGPRRGSRFSVHIALDP